MASGAGCGGPGSASGRPVRSRLGGRRGETPGSLLAPQMRAGARVGKGQQGQGQGTGLCCTPSLSRCKSGLLHGTAALSRGGWRVPNPGAPCGSEWAQGARRSLGRDYLLPTFLWGSGMTLRGKIVPDQEAQPASGVLSAGHRAASPYGHCRWEGGAFLLELGLPHPGAALALDMLAPGWVSKLQGLCLLSDLGRAQASLRPLAFTLWGGLELTGGWEGLEMGGGGWEQLAAPSPRLGHREGRGARRAGRLSGSSEQTRAPSRRAALSRE